MVSPATGSLATTPPTNLTGISTSIPSNLSRRFSTSFSNPLTNHPLSSSTAQMDDKGRRSSLFGSSPPLSRFPTNTNNTTNHINSQLSSFDQPATPISASNHGNTGGIGGLFRKFSTSGRGGVGVSGDSGGGGGMHSFDANEAGPLSNVSESNRGNGGTHAPAARHPHMSTVESLKASQQERPNSPMGNMMLNGQMLD
ncbi:hypothetical protein BGZ98_003340 [Dissophora globulifera]|nr:hypothetical protein BGZ98_003340 [Dissophora globulifera]